MPSGRRSGAVEPVTQRHPSRSPRAHSGGWEVWRDDEGILWTRDRAPQDGPSSAARIAAIEGFLRAGGVRGLVVVGLGGEDSPVAWEAYRGFVAAHPALPIVVVTREGSALRRLLDVRCASRGRMFAVFKSVEAAQAWVRLRSPMGPSQPARGGPSRRGKALAPRRPRQPFSGPQS